MFAKKNTEETVSLQDLIDHVAGQMDTYDAHSDEYAAMADQLKKLYAMKNEKKNNRVSADTAVVVAGNLAGIALILYFERVGIVTSKALGFVMKPRA